jgi:transcriptional regulator with XRE-family HTH domain
MAVGDRIKQARQAAGWSQQRLAEAVGVSQSGISSWETNRTEPTREDVRGLAEALGVAVAQLEEIDDDAPAEARPRGYPLVGKVGAGGEGMFEDAYELGDAAEFIEPLPGMPIEAEIIAVETEGDSMAPLVFEGDLAFFGPIRRDIESLLNKRVMARLSDGRKFFKVLKRGSRAGLWTLRSLNPSSPDIEDVKLLWVLPYRGSRPR